MPAASTARQIALRMKVLDFGKQRLKRAADVASLRSFTRKWRVGDGETCTLVFHTAEDGTEQIVLCINGDVVQVIQDDDYLFFDDTVPAYNSAHNAAAGQHVDGHGTNAADLRVVGVRGDGS